jgi:hypothetical protein
MLDGLVLHDAVPVAGTLRKLMMPNRLHLGCTSERAYGASMSLPAPSRPAEPRNRPRRTSLLPGRKRKESYARMRPIFGNPFH